MTDTGRQSGDKVETGFRLAYEAIVAQASRDLGDWPPLLSHQAYVSEPPPDQRRGPMRPVAVVAASALVLGAVFTAGWRASSATTVEASGVAIRSEPVPPSSVESAATIAEPRSIPFDSPAEAAIAAAILVSPGQENLHVLRIVSIFADETTVDLRVQVEGENFCRWLGVLGEVEGGRLRWRAGTVSLDEAQDQRQCS